MHYDRYGTGLTDNTSWPYWQVVLWTACPAYKLLDLFTVSVTVSVSARCSVASCSHASNTLSAPMPPWPTRPHSHNSGNTASYAPSGHFDADRPLPPLPSTAVDLDIPTLYPRRKPEPENTSTKHGRSFSHPFPFFGGGSKKSEKRNVLKNQINVDSTDDDDSLIGDGRSTPSSNVPSRNASVNVGNGPMTGKCMTCDSTVRWPRDLKVFRCTICLTVNDLEPNQERDQQLPGSNPKNAHAQFAIPRKRKYGFVFLGLLADG